MSDADWLSVPDFAERLGVTASHVRELLRDGALASKRRGERNTVQIPGEFIVDSEDGPVILGTLRGTMTVLRDAGLNDEAVLEWLMTYEAELGTTPLAALLAGQRAPVRRIAQTLL